VRPVSVQELKAYRGMEVQLHPFLASALDEYERSASRPSHLPPGERAPVPIGVWVGPKARLNTVQKRKIHLLLMGTQNF
jgi:hypothetical protein